MPMPSILTSVAFVVCPVKVAVFAVRRETVSPCRISCVHGDP
jgi:hypothetical protein